MSTISKKSRKVSPDFVSEWLALRSREVSDLNLLTEEDIFTVFHSLPRFLRENPG